jgi:acetyl esterase
MRLESDAGEYLARLNEVLPRPLHELGVQAGRTLRMTGSAPAGPALWSVQDISVGQVPGDPRAGDANTAPEDGVELRARVYRPSPASDAPALIYLHGGGWSIGSLDGVDAACRVLAEQTGFVVISVDYRQAPEDPYPSPLQDCWRALRWVASGGAGGLDASRLAVGGDSAGANLAAACALLARDTGLVNLSAQLLVYPPTDAADDSASTRSYADAPVLTSADVRWFWNLYVPAHIDRSQPMISPKRAATLAGLPPTAVITAEHDPIRDDGEDFAARLQRAGVQVGHRRFTGVYHGFFPLVGVIGAADQAAFHAATWLRGTLIKTPLAEEVP